jgi:predicted Zn-dependent protease
MEPDMNCRAREGIQHLQAAARELIQAARALLDVAEDLLDDPAAIPTLARAVAALGDAARRPAATAPEDDGDGVAGEETGTTVERITVA